MIDFIVKHAPTIATVGFFTAFCLIAVWVFAKKNKKRFEDDAKIPMDDDK